VLVLGGQREGVTSDATEELSLLQTTIDGARGRFELILALELTRRGECLHESSACDRRVHRLVRASRSTMCLLIDLLTLLIALDPVTHRRL
jgi:hypothetical protein